MLVYRISKAKYIQNLDGIGSSMLGGRWNKKGTSVVYTSQNISLAALENLVHDPSALPLTYHYATIGIPDDAITDIDSFGISQMHYVTNSPAIGDRLFNEEGVKILKVPSVLIPDESNYILNAQFSDLFKVVKTKPFIFDARLFKAIAQAGLNE